MSETMDTQFLDVHAVVDHRGNRGATRGERLVMGDRNDRNAAGGTPVERSQVAVEGPVVGGDHRRR
jgi:hypothetical protein